LKTGLSLAHAVDAKATARTAGSARLRIDRTKRRRRERERASNKVGVTTVLS